MKIKLKPEQINKLAEDPESSVEVSDPWWVIAAKVIVYLLGLLLAGVGTAEAATICGIVV